MVKVIDPTIDKDLEQKVIEKYNFKLKVFLAGTIDDGNSYNWQDGLIWNIKNYNHSINDNIDESIGDILIYNPRRNNWSSLITQEDLEYQIKWEQEHLDDADLIIMCLQDNSKSPISLLELGLYGPSGKLICFCTPNFYRYTNIKLTCEKYEIPLIKDISIETISNEINKIYYEFL